MSIALPSPIARYFDADQRNGVDIADCFAADAIVRDEGVLHRGVEAIRAWKESASAKYTYKVVPMSMVEDNGLITVSGMVSGNFPGSPVDLRYGFRLAGGRIAELEIIP